MVNICVVKVKRISNRRVRKVTQSFYVTPNEAEGSLRFLDKLEMTRQKQLQPLSPPCYSCAEMVGKKRDKAEYSNSAPAFANYRRNTQLFRGQFFGSFLAAQK